MSPLSPVDSNEQQEGTETRRFLARRGVLLIKETREIGTLDADYGQRLGIGTTVIGIGNSADGDASFGIHLEQVDEDGQAQGSAFLDFIELPELSGALDYIQTIASEMRNQRRDYTEVTYATKDNVRFGFYQEGGKQQAYVNVAPHLSLFMPVQALGDLREVIDQARSHLESKGASAVRRERR